MSSSSSMAMTRPMSRGNSSDMRRSRDRIDSEDRIASVAPPTTNTEAEDEFQSILASMIDEDYIVNATGIKDISRIEYISLQIDTNQQSILDLHDLLPSLKHLVLDNSTIPSIRDLGVGLRHIASLSLSSCGLTELDGIGVLTGLQELNLSDNYISDLTPLTMHDQLQNLNLSGNRIADISFGVVLSSCTNLRSLFLTRNPIERVGQYRGVVSYMIPSLEMLDGTPVDAKDATKITQGTLMDVTTTLSLIEEEMDDEDRLDQEISAGVLGSQHVAISKDFANSTSNKSNTNSSGAGSSNSEIIPDTGSELTHGSSVVLAGNVAAAMRKRRNQSSTNTSSDGKVLSQKNSNSDMKKLMDGDFESPLDVLDSILVTKQNPKISEDKGREYLIEGDITDSVMGLGSPVRNRQKPATDLNIETCMSPTYPRKSAPSSAMGNPGASSFDLDSTSLLSTTKRPKSAFTGTTYRYNPDSPEKPSKDSESNKYAPSPRQINSSRPQSAANPLVFGNNPLPFNVSVKTSRRADANESSDDEDDEKPIDTSNRRIVGRNANAKSPPLLGKSKNASIVHLDIVKRNKNDKVDTIAKRLDLGQLEDLDESNAKEDDESDNEEEIAITHSERLKMMSSSATYTASNMYRSRQSVLMKLQTKPSEISSFPEDIALQRPPSAGKKPSVINGDNQWLGEKSGENTPRQGIAMLNNSLPSGTASKAGISLGFNLAGSLAAIDQWVHDMSSEDDDGEESQNTSGDQTQREHNDFVIEPVQTPRLGLQSSLNTASNPKILSRDAIFHMCSNSSNPKEAKKYRELDPILPSSGTSTARKDSRSSILSEDSQDFEVVTAIKPQENNKPTSHSIVQKAASISSQKAALLSKVAGAKTISLMDPTQRNSADASFVVEEDKPAAATTKTKAPKPTPSYATSTSSSTVRSGQVATRALDMTDLELVDLLRKPPKTISALRTKAGFQEFFRGIDARRFNKLLQMAYQDIDDLSERDNKIKRRMELMDGVFV